MAPTAISSEKQQAEASTAQPGLKSSPPKAQPTNKVKAVSPIKPTPKPPQQKNNHVRSSKPIINWFQRKLAGTGRAKRAENHRSAAEAAALGKGRAVPPASRGAPRVTSSPVPSPGGRQQGRLDVLAGAQRKTISLNGDDEFSVEDDDTSLDQSSFARESTWSPGSALEADDDASVRPIPPSAPPSPSPSRSSSSYLSDPRTFRSIAASTKPTTLLSIDMNGNGMAHIAQAPSTPPSYVNRFPHIRSHSVNNPGQHGSSGASITFSALPQSSSRPSSLSSPGTLQVTANGSTVPAVQAPLHTTHHPRNNPRPSSPPLDNASVLTLASSAYAMPGLRANLGHSTTPSARGVGDSLSHFGGSITYADAESSQFVLGEDDRLEERDVDASVRALRPRSSRRGSWESEASRWSARVQSGPGTPSLARDRSLWTTNSIKTGALSTDNAETYDRSDEVDNGDESIKASPTEESSPISSLSNALDPQPSTETSAFEIPDSTSTHSPDGKPSIDSSPDTDRKVSADTAAHPKKPTVLVTQDTLGEAVEEPNFSDVKVSNGTLPNDEPEDDQNKSGGASLSKEEQPQHGSSPR
ncbi:hypothetical protein Hypma_009549 [Hypsizygus marmoreus]|uniref:Uncharacterized protein n=1 Tax=Hypsizygus marmoreus TaxID=39966 RepID=A0A369JPQ7_HYPMA|nr:hypothetical protein Hypma_009549 [Hypsizygus marmoreus]